MLREPFFLKKSFIIRQHENVGIGSELPSDDDTVKAILCKYADAGEFLRCTEKIELAVTVSSSDTHSWLEKTFLKKLGQVLIA